MTKRQCLTCGFYQPSGSDSMGWCNNPRRKIASDIRLYVRAHELPCRDAWDHDLWEDKTTFAAPADVVLSNNVGPVAPASIDDLVFIASAEHASMSSESILSAEDSGAPVSSVDRVIREESVGVAVTSAGPTAMRGSVRRAHQQLLADKRTERFADSASSMMDGGFSMPSASITAPRETQPTDRLYAAQRPAVDFAATRPAFSAVPPVQPNEMDRSIPKIAIYPGEDDRFSSVPRPVDSVQLPKLSPRERAPVIRSAYFEDDHELNVVQGEALQRDRTERAASTAELTEVDGDVLSNDAAEQSRHADVDDVGIPFETMSEPTDDLLMGQDFARVGRPRHRGGGLFRSRRRQHVEPSYEPAGQVEDEQALAAESAAEQLIAPVFDLPAPVRPESRISLQALADESGMQSELDVEDFGPAMGRRTELWADVPRVCRTCRDFRPAESGDRGWCNNKWAFNHRRMVDADERPCDSSVGCWWLPHDDIWLDASDISAHGQPTPLLDLWLGQRRGREADAESASIGRRRRG